MATQTPQPVTHVYKEINEGKYKSVKHYELQKCSANPVFSNLINISVNQNCAQSMPVFWLKIREGNKWTKYITGLFKTSKKNVYKGDTQRKRNLVVFRFSEDYSTLTIEFYQNYYTTDLRKFL
ncbi:hypothetical protein ACFFU1_14210 [Algibacter miyuki]|uniref:Uncharacterized protein n=1 Tax=Algibacter miyuki TaxID=1306933 RepID=A0ABV5H2D0_9FLAO|nr:hypothetical protein [Algibacter miyuki]MDN3664461.1 hypothetical protein [Algibacter miyuki]MDN3665320.1 hypothetical protein [Algibacter miyuki]MDN3665328.1 hypothetical protein [Algibacter miyuki]